MCPNTSNTVIVTQEDGVVYNHSISLEGLTPAIMRVQTKNLPAFKNIAADGNNTIMNKASDTDVLVISVSVLLILRDLGVEKLWVAFGQEQKKWILINDRSPSIGLEKSIYLLFIHALLAVMSYLYTMVKGKNCMTHMECMTSGVYCF